MIDLGGTLRWARDHWAECLLGAGGIVAAGFAAHSLWRHFTAPRIPLDDRVDGVSIVIPTLNEEKTLPLLLDSIARQKFSRPLEILVVDGGKKGLSTDKTRDIALRFAVERDLDVQVVLAKVIPGEARNIGAYHAKYRHLLFMDADTEMIGTDFLEKTIAQVEAGNIMIGGFMQRPRTDTPDLTLQAWYGAANLIYLHSRSMSQAANLYVRWNLFMWLGGFDEARGLGEDLEFSLRSVKAGFPVHCFPQYVIWDERRIKREGPASLAGKYALTWAYYVGESLGLTTAADNADPTYFEHDSGPER